MLDTLDQLTAAQFIDLVCGDTQILRNGDVTATDSQVAMAMRNIILEYKEITDPAGMKGYLTGAEDLVKAKMSVVIFTICERLVTLGVEERARAIMSDCGIPSGTMDDQRLAAEVLSRLERAKRSVSELEELKSTDDGVESIRREFDQQTAALMAYFKFQIDTDSMKASIYAHLVARFNREVKAMRSAAAKQSHR